MINLDRLYKDADDALKYNDIFLRIVQETKEGINLAENFLDTENAIIEVNAKVEVIRQRGDDPVDFIKLRDELNLLSKAIAIKLSHCK